MLDLEEVKRTAETKAILDVLYRVGGDKEQAAKILCISPRTLRHKINKYNIKVDRRGGPMSEGLPNDPTEPLSLKPTSA